MPSRSTSYPPPVIRALGDLRPFTHTRSLLCLVPGVRALYDAFRASADAVPIQNSFPYLDSCPNKRSYAFRAGATAARAVHAHTHRRTSAGTRTFF